MTTSTKTAIITVPNRNIIAGEYGSSYGHSSSHISILLGYLRFRKDAATITQEVQDDNVVVTINYKGSFGKQNLLEVELFFNKGFITGLDY